MTDRNKLNTSAMQKNKKTTWENFNTQAPIINFERVAVKHFQVRSRNIAKRQMNHLPSSIIYDQQRKQQQQQIHGVCICNTKAPVSKVIFPSHLLSRHISLINTTCSRRLLREKTRGGPCRSKQITCTLQKMTCQTGLAICVQSSTLVEQGPRCRSCVCCICPFIYLQLILTILFPQKLLLLLYIHVKTTHSNNNMSLCQSCHWPLQVSSFLLSLHVFQKAWAKNGWKFWKVTLSDVTKGSGTSMVPLSQPDVVIVLFFI